VALYDFESFPTHYVKTQSVQFPNNDVQQQHYDEYDPEQPVMLEAVIPKYTNYNEIKLKRQSSLDITPPPSNSI
jgi:hypothetical protein